MTEPAERELAAMHRAIALAETVRGRTSPNPAVGAVVLDRAGEIVGAGATQPPGGPHAERVALAQAGVLARGGTVVVTLEPCAHTGRTAPCTQALIEAGVGAVHYALADPNPIAAGGGHRLREAGIEVRHGLAAREAAEGALRPWLHAMTTGRPFVTWKFASTLDGRVAAADQSSRWISSEVSRADVHRLRAGVDAVLVGSGTALADNPKLNVRGPDDTPLPHQPLRVVLDRRHRLDAHGAMFDVDTVVLDMAAPAFALKALYDRGVRHVLLEGGPTLAGAFLAARCVDEVVAYLAPKLLGAGIALLGPAGIDTIADALELDIEDVRRLGPDVRITARPIWPEVE